MKNLKRIMSVLLITIITLTTVVACGNQPVTMQDREGNEFTSPKKLDRILSTAPSNTEVLV
ncbi:MAG: hypothetical protein ACRCST_04500, partial [Turicibacter sp.]